jgi:hypothetical protein
VLSRYLGSWPIAGNTCEATLSVDRPRSITISFEWSHDPGPSENEHLAIALPDIVAAASQAVEELAALVATMQDLLITGKICRIGIRDGCFIYAATDSSVQNDTLTDGPSSQAI